jgi:RNA polymerase sigma-70 factor (ECF subfamily)
MNRPSPSVNDLAKACAHSASEEEWGDFVRLCTPLASLVALRIARMWSTPASPAAVADIVQEIFLKLCEQQRRILREFEPRGEDSFLALLRIVSASVANDFFRRQYSAKRGGKVVTMPLPEDGSAMASDGVSQQDRAERSALLAQLDSKLRSAPGVIAERDRTLFWLYYRQGFTAEEIARFGPSGLTPKGVESALRRVTVWLRGEVERRPLAEQGDSGPGSGRAASRAEIVS